MSHIVMQTSDILDCEDFSFAQNGQTFRFFDHSEGCGITLTRQELLNAIAVSLLPEYSEDEHPSQYEKDLAVNILANAVPSGIAQFMFNMLP